MAEQPFDPDRPVDPSTIKATVVDEATGEPFTGSLFVVTCDARMVGGRLAPVIHLDSELGSDQLQELVPSFLRKVAHALETGNASGFEEEMRKHDAQLAGEDLRDFYQRADDVDEDDEEGGQ